VHCGNADIAGKYFRLTIASHTAVPNVKRQCLKQSSANGRLTHPVRHVAHWQQ